MVQEDMLVLQKMNEQNKFYNKIGFYVNRRLIVFKIFFKVFIMVVVSVELQRVYRNKQQFNNEFMSKDISSRGRNVRDFCDWIFMFLNEF